MLKKFESISGEVSVAGPVGLAHWLAHTKQLWSHRLDNLDKLLKAEREKER